MLALFCKPCITGETDRWGDLLKQNYYKEEKHCSVRKRVSSFGPCYFIEEFFLDKNIVDKTKCLLVRPSVCQCCKPSFIALYQNMLLTWSEFGFPIQTIFLSRGTVASVCDFFPLYKQYGLF